MLAELRRLGCEVTVRPTGGRGDAEQLAASADPNRYDVLVVAGGDGTINEAVNGLRDARLPLAIVPLGTANVLAAEIGMATDPRTVARTIALGRPRPISVGVANGRRFLLMAGTGFDAHVVQHVDLALKRLDRQSRLWDRDPAPAAQLRFSRIRRDDRRQDLRRRPRSWSPTPTTMAAGSSARRRPTCARRPSRSACSSARGRLSVIGYALAMLTGRLPKLKSYRMVAAGKVHIDGGSDEPVQGDGDIIGHLDVTIEVVPEALHLVYPPTAAEAAGADRRRFAALAKTADRTGSPPPRRAAELRLQAPSAASRLRPWSATRRRYPGARATLAEPEQPR